MNSRLIPITFANKSNHTLFGILHKPEKVLRKEAIILLSPGIKNRVAPHRLYVKMANAFAEIGFTVFRFDYYGLGDSEGEIDEELTADLYGSIEVGRYVDDTISAMNWLNSENGIKQFILAGLCGGAITGLLSSIKDTRVVGLLGLALPIILSSSSVTYDKFLTATELSQKRSFYVNKLFTVKAWRSWIRFLTFQSDYRLIFRSLFLSKFTNKNDNSKVKQDVKNPKVPNIVNPHFIPTLKKAIELGQNYCLIFAEADRHYWQFFEHVIDKGYIDFKKHSNIELTVIKNANHIFSFTDWQSKMLRTSVNWLNRKFASDT